jgi:hypothetical protein
MLIFSPPFRYGLIFAALRDDFPFGTLDWLFFASVSVLRCGLAPSRRSEENEFAHFGDTRFGPLCSGALF